MRVKDKVMLQSSSAKLLRDRLSVVEQRSSVLDLLKMPSAIKI
jgi:hypothetical protein